jgi:hypothetical protein
VAAKTLTKNSAGLLQAARVPDQIQKIVAELPDLAVLAATDSD